MAVALLRDRSEAEDVIQETFVDVWRRAKDFDPARGSAGGWICSIARNHAIDRLRSRDAAARALAAAPREPAGPPPPPAIELATARQEREAVVAALDSLPPEQRTAIELAYYEGLSQREIAERQGEPIGTIKTRVRLAMQKLSGLLAGLGGPS
jgi:RNA polymerase sigma-70 factor (ECF subfamily)